MFLLFAKINLEHIPFYTVANKYAKIHSLDTLSETERTR